MSIKRTAGFVGLAGLILAGALWIARSHTKADPPVSSSVAETAGFVKPVQAASDIAATPVLSGSKPSVTPPAESWKNSSELRDILIELRHLLSQSETDEVRARLVALIRQWAEHDVRAAAEWVQKMQPGEAKTEALTAVAIAFAQQDLQAGITWVWQLPEGEDRNHAIRSLSYEAARTDPVAALTLAAGSLKPDYQRDDLINFAALQWAAKDPRAAVKWADQIQDKALRNSVLVNVTTAWGESDPAAAAKFVVEEITPGRAQKDAVAGIVQRWAQKDRDAAERWTWTIEDNELTWTAVDNLGPPPAEDEAP